MTLRLTCLTFFALPLVAAPLLSGCEEERTLGTDRAARGDDDDDDDDMTPGCGDAGTVRGIDCYQVTGADCCAPAPPAGACLDECPVGASEGVPADGVRAGECSAICGASDPCEAMDVGVDDPSCDAELGFYWDGRACVSLDGCACVGSDCAGLFPDAATCLRAYATCLRR